MLRSSSPEWRSGTAQSLKKSCSAPPTAPICLANRIRHLTGSTPAGQTSTLDIALHPRLAKHRILREARRRAWTSGDRVIIRHRESIVDRQLVLERLADMAIDLFATAAVIARTQSLIDDRGEEECESEIALCNLFCIEAGRRFATNRGNLDPREEEIDDTRRGIAELRTSRILR